LELQPITVTGSINALLRVIALARCCDKEKAKETPVTLLNSDLIASYWKVTATENRTTTASRLNQAQAVFSTRAMGIYRRKWNLPDLAEFSSAPKLRKRISDQTFKDFGTDVAGQLEWAAQEIRQIDLDTLRIYLLAARLGLRDKEIFHVRGDWIEERRGKWVLAIIDRPHQPFHTKAGVNRWLELSQELIDEFCTEIGTPCYLVAEGKPPTTRQNAVYRTASAFVRRHLPGRSKSLHELRKYAGARIATEHGLYAAKEFLGHATISTTEKHYAAYLKNVCAVSAVPMIPPLNIPTTSLNALDFFQE
jgi:integrase